jgi:hypothetical protein
MGAASFSMAGYYSTVQADLRSECKISTRTKYVGNIGYSYGNIHVSSESARRAALSAWNSAALHRKLTFGQG